MTDRHKKILELLSDNEEVSVQAMAEKLQVSSVTIRQDLNLLEEQGLLKRVHGGAILKDADNLDIRMAIHYDTKLRIARKAAGFVKPGETVLLESGSINALIAREIVKKDHVTIITTNLYIARQFRDEPNARIVVAGGIYQHVSESLVGSITRLSIDHLNFNKAFLGIDGFTRETGFTSRDLLRADISSYIIRKGRQNFIVSDSSKFGQLELTTICHPAEIDYVITDKGLDDVFDRPLLAKGVKVVRV